jgi:segregation and condensation protein A
MQESEKTEFVLAVEGYEGPIDFLLDLARAGKIDLSRISILEIAEQFLAFLAARRRLSLELAADYLVMAAFLAFLKSRLLLPDLESAEEAPEADPIAALRRRQLLEAIEAAIEELLRRPQLGRDVFLRGAPEGLRVRRLPSYELQLYALLRAYGEGLRRQESAVLRIESTSHCAMEEALDRLLRVIGRIPEWRDLLSFLPDDGGDASLRRSALAATLSASLELAHSGRVELRQDRPFGPIYLRSSARLGAESGEPAD